MDPKIEVREEACFKLFGYRHKPYRLRGSFWRLNEHENLRFKTKMATREEALAFAREHGITDLPEELCDAVQTASATD